MKILSKLNINIFNKNTKIYFFSKFLYVMKKIYKNNLLFAIGSVVVFTWIIIALLANFIIPYNPLSQDMAHRFEPPSTKHWLGTDILGRDLFSRIIAGSRISILAGLIAVSVSTVVGTLFGGIAGYLGGFVDDVMMRIAEMFRAFPSIILAMTITAALGPSLFNTLIALSIVSWPKYARVMRSMVISIKQNEYIEAAKASGASNVRILLKEILPNSAGGVLILSSLDIGNQILRFAGLSFLGLGAPPPTPEWGSIIAEGASNFHYWWITFFPGLAILTMALGANFIGDGVRDYLDPKLRKNL